MEQTSDLVELHSFFDAFTAGQACNELKQAGILFEVADRSAPREGLKGDQSGPPVWLVITVRSRDLNSARSLLHETMALFPEREVAVESEPSDDEPGGFIQVVSCDEPGEAEEIRQFLASAGFNSVVNHSPTKTASSPGRSKSRIKRRKKAFLLSNHGVAKR